MTTTYLIKFIIVALVLIILWCIARKQEELGSKIEVLDKKQETRSNKTP